MVRRPKPTSLFTLSLCSKSHSRRSGDRVHSEPDRPKAVRSRRKRTLLSFQRPGRRDGVKKAPTRARGPRKLGKHSRIVRRALRFRRLQGLSYTARSGSRGIVARRGLTSTGDEPQEASPPRLEDRSVELGPRVVVPDERAPLELHPALIDRAPPVAR